MKYFEFDVESIECSFSQTINLNEGWSIISTYINPENTNIESVFNSVVNDIEIIKDENGNVYWPLFGLNSIGDLIIGEGYQVKMNSFNQITVEGSLIPFDTPISFDEGWNLIGYLHPEDANTVDMMNSIVTNDGPLRILKNGLGVMINFSQFLVANVSEFLRLMLHKSQWVGIKIRIKIMIDW